MKRGLFWFRSDLRLADNPALSKAAGECEELALIIPEYLIQYYKVKNLMNKVAIYANRFLNLAIYQQSTFTRLGNLKLLKLKNMVYI